jgi:hypothetical protein
MASLLLVDLNPSSHLWEECRNGLGIARLLVQERRPEEFVATACRGAAESACRAALLHAGFKFEGDLEGALDALEAPGEVRFPQGRLTGAEWVERTEELVGWLASYLRNEVPGRSWGY